MPRLADVVHDHLQWVQPRLLDRHYELRRGDEPVATLSFRSAFGSLAIARADGRSWSFKRVGFWKPRATVRVEGEPTDLATFAHDTWKGGGSLRLADGRVLRVTTNMWQSKIEFLGPDEGALFQYETEGFFRQEAVLTVMPGLAEMPEMPWLLLFGWYLVVMLHEDSAATVAVIAAAG
jgi:hypothetical protein